MKHEEIFEADDANLIGSTDLLPISSKRVRRPRFQDQSVPSQLREGSVPSHLSPHSLSLSPPIIVHPCSFLRSCFLSPCSVSLQQGACEEPLSPSSLSSTSLSPSLSSRGTPGTRGRRLYSVSKFSYFFISSSCRGRSGEGMGEEEAGVNDAI